MNEQKSQRRNKKQDVRTEQTMGKENLRKWTRKHNQGTEIEKRNKKQDGGTENKIKAQKTRWRNRNQVGGTKIKKQEKKYKTEKDIKKKKRMEGININNNRMKRALKKMM